MLEDEFKNQELERLLSENKISLEQYLDARAKISGSKPHANNPKAPVSTEEHKAPERKTSGRPFCGIALAAILCVALVVCTTSVLGIFNPLSSEKLTIESHSLSSLVSEGIVTFNVKNSGITNIQISSIEVNGYSNQSYPGLANTDNAWFGTLSLKAGSEGVINVNLPCYFHAFLSALSPMSSPPTEEEIAELNSTMYSLLCRFTFVSSTQREYTYDVPDLFSTVLSLGSQSMEFLEVAEQGIITNLEFSISTSQIIATFKNTGNSDITLTACYINGQIVNLPSQTSIPKGATQSITLAKQGLTLNSGVEYQVKLTTSKGNNIVYTATSP